jgi:hypothetical protein
VVVAVHHCLGICGIGYMVPRLGFCSPKLVRLDDRQTGNRRLLAAVFGRDVARWNSHRARVLSKTSRRMRDAENQFWD